jgi:hypothetical protein
LEWQSSIILDEILNFLSAISKGKVPVKCDTTMCRRLGSFGNYINELQLRNNAKVRSTEMETSVLIHFMKMGKGNCKYGCEADN